VADFSGVEDPRRYNAKEANQQSVGRFNVTLKLVEDIHSKYGATLLE